MKECRIHIEFSPITNEQVEALFEIEQLFSEKLGIKFDTGSLIAPDKGAVSRDWEWDWSLKGPVKIHLVEQKGE